MISITRTISIPWTEVEVTYARSGGPGGQNVNKVSSKVLLRWNPGASQAMPADVKARFLAQQASKLTKEGDLLLTGQRFRDQARNLEDCVAKLREMVLRALHPPKVRRPTKPSRGSK